MQSIPPDVYDRDYFLSEICEGYDEFQEGRGVSHNKSKQVNAMKAAPGLRILDAGCGRGEVLFQCAKAGAEVAGVDYSQTAVELTKETLVDYPGADIRQGDVTALPWDDNSFDRILFSDVIEHLDAPQTVPALAEFRRVLKPGGYLLVHTAPNLFFMKYGWPVIRPFLRILGHGAIVDRVDAWFKIAEEYHVNEQGIHSLRKAMKAAGFQDPKVWLDPDVLRSGQYHLLESFDSPIIRLGRKIAALRPIRLFLGNDLYGLGHK